MTNRKMPVESMNDNDPPLIWIITGSVTRRKGGKESQVHVILRAPDDDSAVRLTLEAVRALRPAGRPAR